MFFYFRFLVLVLTYVVTLPETSAQLTLTAPIVTDKGTWKNWEMCPEYYFVTSADLATHTMPPEGKHKRDNIGVYSIILKCKHIDHIWEAGCANTKYIKAEMGGISTTSPCETFREESNAEHQHRQDSDCTDGEGTSEFESGYRFQQDGIQENWGARAIAPPIIKYNENLRTSCKDLAVGFSLRSDHAKLSSDSSGANNLRLHCSDLAEQSPDFQEGYGVYEGSWTEAQICPPEYALCGIQVQADDLNTSAIDYIGINSVRMKCCHVPNPALTCNPSDRWENIAECDNSGRDNAATYSCGYRKVVGLGSNSAKDPRDFEKRYFYEGIGYRSSSNSLPYWLTSGLAVNFEYNLTVSSTGHDWKASSESTWSPEDPVDEYVEIVGTKKVTVSQIVGRCAWFYVRTTSFKIVTSESGGDAGPIIGTTEYNTYHDVEE